MECKKFKKKLVLLADKSLPADEEKQLLLHLESCGSCMESYVYLTGFEKLIQEEKSTEISPFFYTKLSGRLESISAPAVKFNPLWLRLAHAGILAIIVIAAVYSGLMLGIKQTNIKQADTQNNISSKQDITVTDEQFADNFPTY
jgi:hypothetical protein